LVFPDRISTVLTWQHHWVDIAGGLVLAGFAFYVCRGSDSRRCVTPNLRVGCYYTAGAVLVLTLAKALGLWGAFLLWPAAGLAITAGAYSDSDRGSSAKPMADCR